MNTPEKTGQAIAQSLYASPAAPVGTQPLSLLGQVLARENSRSTPYPAAHLAERSGPSSLDQFLSAEDDATRLLLWFGEDRLRKSRGDSGQWILEQLDRDIATIDSLVETQLNVVLHEPRFQRLEASWRGINHLVEKREECFDAKIVIRLLNVSWSELSRDLQSAIEFDQSEVFKKIYEEGIGQAGADPLSVLIADYYIHPILSQEHRFDDVAILRELASVTAAAFCPMIINAHPSMFAVDHFCELNNNVKLQSLHSGLDFFAWQRFREIEDSRFVGVALPQILMRRPYRENYDLGFPFTERVDRLDDYLWGGAAFGMAEVLMRSFADSGWFANMRGAKRGVEDGGIVTGPAFDPFSTEPNENAPRSITDTVLTDEFERELSGAGFLPLCACKDSPFAAFYSSASAQKPKEYTTQEATMSARLSTMLNYILCVSRFAHYLKWIARDRIGSCATPGELEDILQKWILDYVAPDKNASASTRLRKPLLEAQIKVMAIPGKAGEYESVFHLVPHHELDDMRVSIRLDTKLMPARR